VILEAVILLIFLVPVVILVLIRRKRDGATTLRTLLRQIVGNFLLVAGILLLFPACYQAFHGPGGRSGIALLLISLLLVFGGYFLVEKDKRRKSTANG